MRSLCIYTSIQSDVIVYKILCNNNITYKSDFFFLICIFKTLVLIMKTRFVQALLKKILKPYLYNTKLSLVRYDRISFRSKHSVAYYLHIIIGTY